MLNFKSLADASNIIGSITNSVEIQHKEYVKKEGINVVEQIMEYLHEFFIPLYGCKALENRNLAMSSKISNVSIVNTKCHKRGVNKFSLGFNVPLGGSRTFLTLNFYEHFKSSVEGDINEITIKILIENWHKLKFDLEKKVQHLIEDNNLVNKRKVDELIEFQSKIENFKI